ncbi:DUF2497 domain-containing protein [uncultured Sphingomonas sp.]|uniref:DUF2497 domain-containing protein n=1 Tax=uncultured Sphingomonas sp. TaxID=158754 RepID=UPI0025EBD5EB|nr:DUF2497 domain-containing protein [uncultured Sphingomonas sp.]
MGDLSGEPSMEDILASIKRVIKEGEAPAPRRAPPVAPRAEEDVVSHDAILELNEPLSSPPPAPPSVAPRGLDAFEEQRPVAPPPVATPAPSPTPTLAPAPAPAPTLAPIAGAAPEPEGPPVVSPATVEATRGALGALSRLIVKPEPDSDGTLEGLVRDMLRPMLSDWLDQNLPRLVEQMVAREIAKITRQN